MTTPVNRTARSLSSVALLAAALSLNPSAAFADEPAKGSVAVKSADNSESHLAKAKEYKHKAVGYRAEAAAHQKMLADSRGEAKTERPDEDPDRKAMRIHCEGFIEKAEALATEAEKFADYHRMRAAELKGK